jgi:hypothetical protein
MLIFHSHCQMGNQMFIYACADSLSTKKGVSFALSDMDSLIYFESPHKNRLRNFFNYQRFRTFNKLNPGKFTFYHLQDNRVDHSTSMLTEHSANAWYYGYFQGPSYFFGREKEVRKLFSIREKYRRKYEQIMEGFPRDKKLITVHLRRNDYKTFGPDFLGGPDLSLPFEYYHKLMKDIDPKDANVVFISDQMEEIKKEFSYLKNAYFSSHEPIVDLQFLIHADVCIIANSTFGWWGAFLNEKDNKRIYVPEFFLGFKVQKEFPVNMIPKEWTQIRV